MAEIWKPGGSYIIVDGEKLLKIDGIRVVNKRPVKAVVYYRLAELEAFLRNFIRSLYMTQGGEGLPEDQITNGVEKYTKETIKMLENRRSVWNDSTYFSSLSLLLIVSSAFDLGVWQVYGSSIYIPTFYREMRTIDAPSSDICLPDDIVNSEIYNRMLSPRSLLKMRMVSKSIKCMKYKYEHLISIVPRQASLILSKLYDDEKDPRYKEYLFSLAIKAYSSVKPTRRIDYRDVSNSTDIMVALSAIYLQTEPYDPNVDYPVNQFYEFNIDLLNILIEEGFVNIKNVTLFEHFFSEATSLPDSFIPFIERWEAATGKQSGVRLYDDLKGGNITYPYNWRLMLDIIKKGYIKEPYSIKDKALEVIFLRGIEQCSEEDKLLLLSYFEPNPITDFFLGGVRPTVETVVKFFGSRRRKNCIADYISFGLRFSDDDVDYESLLVATIFLGDQWDFRLIPELNNIFFLKVIEEDVYLVLSTNEYREYGIYVIRSLGAFFIQDNTFPTTSLFIECIANATDHLLQRIIEYAQSNEEILECLHEETDPSISDLEFYKKFVQNISTIVGEAR